MSIINLSLLFSYGVTTRFSTEVPQCKEHPVQVQKEEPLPEHSQPWEPALALRGARKRVSWETGLQQGWMCPLISSAWCSCCASDAPTRQDLFPARLGCAPCSMPVIRLNTYAALTEICAEHLDTWPYFWDSSNVICCKNPWWSKSFVGMPGN